MHVAMRGKCIMDTKKQLAIIAVAALIASVSLLSGVAIATTPTTTTIATSNATPLANQPFTLTGTLKSGSTPLSGKLITLGRTDPSGTWSIANTTTTDANGAYTFTRSESALGYYSYQAIFSGDTYASSKASVRLVVGA